MLPMLMGWCPIVLAAQAPAAAGLWRVATASLATPAALERGPTGAFWNPAAEPPGQLAAAVQIVQTSDILGLSGFLAGATYGLGGGSVGLLVGRMDVRDLVRTTTSPSSQAGTIPVFEQLAGIVARFGDGPLSVGGALRLHDAQFDAIANQGVTLDLGVRARPHPRLTVAAASQFLPLDLGLEPTTDYFAGAEYQIGPAVALAGLPSRLFLRYGGTYHAAAGELDHGFGAGVVMDRNFRIDVALTGEAAYGRRAWRPGLGLSLQVGRYTLGVARSEGLNDVGATYRIALDLAIRQ